MKEGTSTAGGGGGSFPKKHPERLVWCLIIMIIIIMIIIIKIIIIMIIIIMIITIKIIIIMIIIIMIIHLFAGAFQGPQGRLTEHQLSMSMRITDLEGLE